MAITSTDKLIDLNRLGAFLTKLRNTFVAKVEGKDLSDNNLTDEMVAQIAKIETLIAEGGEPNKIEVVKVDGTALAITDKAVNIEMPIELSKGVVTVSGTLEDDTESTIAFKASTNGYTFTAGAGDTAVEKELVSKTYVDANGGKIDKIKVNGTEQTITNKEVDIPVPELYSEEMGDTGKADMVEISDDSCGFAITKDGMVSLIGSNGVVDHQFTLLDVDTAEATYRTEAQVDAAITAALADITGVSFQLVTELPETGESGIFYLKPITGGKSKNLYEEFVWINKGTTEAPDFDFESLGPTSVDLTGYLKETDITLATTEDIDGLFTPATGE